MFVPSQSAFFFFRCRRSASQGRVLDLEERLSQLLNEKSQLQQSLQQAHQTHVKLQVCVSLPFDREHSHSRNVFRFYSSWNILRRITSRLQRMTWILSRKRGPFPVIACRALLLQVVLIDWLECSGIRTVRSTKRCKCTRLRSRACRRSCKTNSSLSRAGAMLSHRQQTA